MPYDAPMAEPVDLGVLYREAREDFERLVRSLSPGQLATPVPACSPWTVHDVVAHVVGEAVEAVAGGGGAVSGPDRVADHVAERSSTPTTVVLREWERAATQFELLLSKSGGSAVEPVVDLVTHEHDVRGAVGLPGNRDSRAVQVGTERVVSLWFSKIESAGLPDVVIHDGSDDVVAGRFDAPVGFRASPFEIFRAGHGRRSRSQIEGRFHDTDDPAAYVPLLCLRGPAESDIVE